MSSWVREDWRGSKWLSTRIFDLPTARMQQLTKLNIQIDWLDFIAIDYQLSLEAHTSLEELFQASCPYLVMASQNSVCALSQYAKTYHPTHSLQSNLLCIGKQTSLLASEKFPNSHVQYLGDNMQNSLNSIAALSRLAHPLYFCAAQDPLPILPDFLRRHAIDFQHIALYKTILQVHKISKVYDGILFYSPSGVRAFFRANHDYPQVYNKSLIYGCIGKTTAQALQKFYPQSDFFLPKYTGKLGLIDFILGIN